MAAGSAHAAEPEAHVAEPEAHDAERASEREQVSDPLAERPLYGLPVPMLRFSSDERLVARARDGDRRAFEAIYQRHGSALLGYCRQMLGSLEEAEDALQQTFFKAYRSLTGERNGSPTRTSLRPWLFTIARHESISILRRRRPEMATLEDEDIAGDDVAAEVQGREDLRAMFADLARLPAEQREALVLTTLDSLSGAEIGEVIGCEPEQVKSLVFRARRSLAASREARNTSCAEVREQLAILRGGSLRRKVLREHLVECEGCRAFRFEVNRQRRLLSSIIPVAPLPVLKFLTGASAGKVGAAGAVGIGVAGSAGGAGGAAGGDALAKLAIGLIGVTVILGGGSAGDGTGFPADDPSPPPAISAPVPEYLVAGYAPAEVALLPDSALPRAVMVSRLDRARASGAREGGATRGSGRRGGGSERAAADGVESTGTSLASASQDAPGPVVQAPGPPAHAAAASRRAPMAAARGQGGGSAAAPGQAKPAGAASSSGGPPAHSGGSGQGPPLHASAHAKPRARGSAKASTRSGQQPPGQAQTPPGQAKKEG